MNRISITAAPGAAKIRAESAKFDRTVGLKMRQRRIMLGLTQQQMAALIGVSYQQSHKYETGVTRISAGRLYQMARALGVDISYFFEDVERPQKVMPQQRMLLELARNFATIPHRGHQEAVCSLVRALNGYPA